MSGTKKICVVGLGYVGLPLAVEFAKFFDVVGYDLSHERVHDLKIHQDPNREVDSSVLRASRASWTSDISDLEECDVFIITVPTPVDENNEPDLFCIKEASKSVGSVLSKGGLVIYESTVFPGCTEEVCKPILEQVSGLQGGQDFYLGYSPERVNPADKVNTISQITKVVSGCCPESLDLVDMLYSKIVEAGTYRAPSIRVAEASKVTENIQRDVNIALMNELSTVYNQLGVDTFEVIKAAASKWNFIPFRPGLVGGHCIGVDPYYLVSKARQEGIETPLISASREINENVVERVADRLKKQLAGRKDTRVLLLGLTFKEDCPDIRNSKSLLLAERISEFTQVEAMDPFVNEQISDNFRVINDFSNEPYDCVIISVLHKNFLSMNSQYITELLKENGEIYDLLNGFPNIKDYSL